MTGSGEQENDLSHGLSQCLTSLISHSSKVMLKVILNRLKPQAKKIIAEEQAGFRAGRSIAEQIFNIYIPCEKYFQHRKNLYHVFIDFKKAFDRVWHAALWAPCGSTTSVQIKFAPLSSYTTRLQLQSR